MLQNRNFPRTVLVLAVILIVISGCKNKAAQPPTPRSAGNTPSDQVLNNNAATQAQNIQPKELVVTVIEKNYSFSPSEIRVKKGQKVRLEVKNTEGTHDFIVSGYNAAAARMPAGAGTSLIIIADTAGTFDFYSDIGQDRELGMTGTLIVE